MRIRSPHLAVLTVLVIFAGIGATMIAGFWESESSKTPAMYTSGKFAGEYNPADIRGSYSFDDVASAFNVPVDVLVRAFGFETYDKPRDLQIKLFEEVYGEIDGLEVGTDSMRFFVALYLSQSYIPEEGTGLPRQAISVLKQEERVDEQTLRELRETYEVELTGLLPESEAAALEEVEEEEEETTIKGKTTFEDLVEWGVSREEIEGVIGMTPGAPTQALRDFLMEQGEEFSTVKEELQKLIDERQGE